MLLLADTFFVRLFEVRDESLVDRSNIIKRNGQLFFPIRQTPLFVLLMAVLLLVSDKYFMSMSDPSEFERIIRLVIFVVMGMAVYGAGVFATGAIRIADVKSLFIR